MDLANIPRELDTPDLHLRPLNMDDAEAMFAILSDLESMKYWSHTPATDISVAIKTLTEDLESDAKGNSMCWAATRKGKALGGAGRGVEAEAEEAQKLLEDLDAAPASAAEQKAFVKKSKAQSYKLRKK